MTNSIILRKCPYCDGNEFTRLAFIKVETLLKYSPGHVDDWFTEATIPLDMECPIVRCNNCQFVYVETIPEEKMLARFYNEGISEEFSEAKIYKLHKRERLINLWQKLHSHVSIEEKIKVLDFGAGWCDFLAVAKCVSVDVFGVEIVSQEPLTTKEKFISCFFPIRGRATNDTSIFVKAI